jgi:hypothetical protein
MPPALIKLQNHGIRLSACVGRTARGLSGSASHPGTLHDRPWSRGWHDLSHGYARGVAEGGLVSCRIPIDHGDPNTVPDEPICHRQADNARSDHDHRFFAHDFPSKTILRPLARNGPLSQRECQSNGRTIYVSGSERAVPQGEAMGYPLYSAPPLRSGILLDAAFVACRRLERIRLNPGHIQRRRRSLRIPAARRSAAERRSCSTGRRPFAPRPFAGAP